MKIEDLLEKDVVTQEDMKKVIGQLEEMKEDIGKLLDLKGDGLSYGARAMMKTDMQGIKTFIEIMSDLEGEDFEHQDRIKQFLDILIQRLKLTVHKRFLPLINSLKGEIK